MTPTEHVLSWRLKISQAALAFESRWTLMALRNHDPDLAQALYEQQELFWNACRGGSPNDVAVQGAAMLRGYTACINAMEEAQIPDDSYLLGVCPTTGYKVAVGVQKAAVARVVELHGQDVVWISPDEVATLMASSQAFMSIAAIKKKFPGAEVVERYASEGS